MIQFNPFYILIKNKWLTEITLTGRNPDFKGKAVWPFIFYKGDAISRTLLEHEKIHLSQQLEGWIIGFYIKYFYYNWKFGYKNNPYEIEAYTHQDDWQKHQDNRKANN